ncbi:MAG: MBL fold metallo-hydrolase [Sedimentisphaerales bacterium]|nr:MBL fold metallo-hydrolase [Sedimentisphaerales bacterium]
MGRSIITLLAILACCLQLGIAQQQQVQLIKLSERVFEVKGGRGATGGVVVGHEAVLLIDTKMDQTSVEQTLAAVRGITDRPIRYLVNTHSDGDHTAGNRYMPTGITIISHQNCRKELFLPGRDGRPSQWADPKMAEFIPSITFSEGLDMHLGTTKVELRYFGIGHTTGDIVVYIPQDQIAFIGDQVFVGRTPLIHAYKGGSSLQQVKTLERMLAGLPDARTFCSGHAELVNRDAIMQYIEAMRTRHQKVRQLIKEGQSLDQIKASFPTDQAALIEIIWNELYSGQ